MIHKTVLLHEAIDGLDIHEHDVFVDGTLGGGGHTQEVLRRYGSTVRIVGIDADADAIERAKVRLGSVGKDVVYIEGNFSNIRALLASHGISEVQRILLDIGLSSNQFEDSERGFSFQKNEPLIMSFKKDITSSDLTAREIVNTWDEENIKAILEGYGEERFAWRIAKAITQARVSAPIETTFQLVDIIMKATPTFYHHRKIHPATKTFQALRITVNNEIENLKQGIVDSFSLITPGGRLAIISFHSLEDRVVKQFFKQIEESGEGRRITKRPIIPTEHEILENPRSRSAKMRIIEKI